MPVEPPSPLPDLSSLAPSRSLLLDKLRLRIPGDILQEIALADYGRDASEHLAALRRIQGQGVISRPLDWAPKEVLELTKWSEPDELKRINPEACRRDHLARLFCCTVLLYAMADGESNISSETDTLAQFVASATALGKEYINPARRFVAWLAPNPPDIDETQGFMVLALLILISASDPRKVDTSSAGPLIEWLEKDVLRLEGFPTGRHPERWLLGLTYFDIRRDTWEKLAERWLSHPNRRFPTDLRGDFEKLGRHLITGRRS
ncbi:MAG: hypothetical protein WDZ31_04270 [Phycisphaeraceae bacterium]